MNSRPRRRADAGEDRMNTAKARSVEPIAVPEQPVTYVGRQATRQKRRETNALLEEHANTVMDDDLCRQLLKRVCAQDRAAFTTIYECMKGALFRYQLNQLRNRAVAEEATQETLLAVWKRACSFRGESTVAGWIFGIGANISRMIVRGRARQPIHEDVDEHPEAESLQSEAVLPFEHMTQLDRTQGIHDCMGRLSPEHREVLYLSLYQDLSYSEIARILDVPENTVKTRAYYAREKIRPCIERLLRSEGERIPGVTDEPTDH